LTSLIVGLGNPGEKYKLTYHNIGFILIDLIAERFALSFKSKHQGLIAKANYQGHPFYLFKPQTYMNLSGRAVIEAFNYYKLDFKSLLVVYDDLDLPLAKLRHRAQGSSGGHRGMQDIINVLGTDKISRLKVGINNDTRHSAADYVLARIDSSAQDLLADSLAKAQSYILDFITNQEIKIKN